METKSIQIEAKLYSEIVEYCKLNSLKIGEYCSKKLREALNDDKWGEIPFGYFKEKKKKEEPVTTIQEEKNLEESHPLEEKQEIKKKTEIKQVKPTKRRL